MTVLNTSASNNEAALAEGAATPPLNAKQRRFATEYLIDLDATQAAIRAGYSPISAEKIGRELLRDERLFEAIHADQMRRVDKVHADIELLLTELTAFSNVFGRVVDDRHLCGACYEDHERYQQIAAKVNRQCTAHELYFVEAFDSQGPIYTQCWPKWGSWGKGVCPESGARLQLHQKIAALDMIAKLFGHYKQHYEYDPVTLAVEVLA